MLLTDVLRCWATCHESEDYSPFLEVVKRAIQNGTLNGDVSKPTDAKALNSLLSSAFSEHYPVSVQRTVLDFIQFLGSDLFLRHRLITSFSILKTLFYGLVSKGSGPDQLKLLKVAQLYTTDLHHICDFIEPELFSSCLKFILRIVRQSKEDDSLECALGILASLARFTDLIHQCLNKKDDFEVIRKCLLHIMGSESVSQSSLVFSMAVRFYLWKGDDKFFEGVNVHKTIQILFNLLLNGEISLCGLCAGELLSDMCSEPQIMPLLASYPTLKECIKETLIQLKSKDTALVLKLLHLLRHLLENGTEHGVEGHVRDLVLIKAPEVTLDEDENNIQRFEPLTTLFNLTSCPDDLVACAALDFLISLINNVYCGSAKGATAQPGYYTAHELLRLVMTHMRKANGSASSLRLLREVANGQQSLICSRLLRLLFFIRIADDLVQQIQASYSPESPQSSDVDTVDHLAVFGQFLHQIVLGQLEDNPLINALPKNSPEGIPIPMNTSDEKVDVDSCLVSASLVLESMGLLYSCTEWLSIVAPGCSQDDEISLTQPTKDDDVEVEIKPTQNVARRCGHLLQSLLERTEMPGLFALGLLTSSPHLAISGRNLGMGLGARTAVVRLLTASLHLDGFDSDEFARQVNLLQPTGTNSSDLLGRICDAAQDRYQSTPSFLAQWFYSPAGGPHPVLPVGNAYTRSAVFDGVISEPRSAQCPDQLEKKVNEFLLRWDSAGDGSPSFNSSDVLSVFEYKIRLLQSRENVLETSMSRNAEALASAIRLSEFYRERAAIAESESSELRALQLSAVARMEADKKAIKNSESKLTQYEARIADLQTQLAQQEKLGQDLASKNESLQSKLKTARDQNRAMDATIDDYRNQLDQAKEQIRLQTAQIAKFTEITRIINGLTGNPGADVTTVGLSVSGDDQQDSLAIQGASDTNGRPTTMSTRKMCTRNARR
ncbi:unnamed protein product [Calicophoron daubneyi]|uniref:CIP2A N-terminal domain-containing protein n=1 Tax=Calicophoron daubneyi TaxID=300641 RepID=A0AAV2TCW7_CALDB